MSDEEHILICAVRYALGRRSYIVGLVCTYVACKQKELSEHCVDILIQDIEEELERYDRAGQTLGDDCDERDWKKLLEVLKEVEWMSMISELVNKLRFYEAGCKGAEFKKVLGEAVNVIEEQGAKLQRLNMERSSQFYNNGWIPCDERLPKAEDLHNISREECKSYLVQRRCGVMQVAHYIKVYGEPYFEFCTLKINGVIAWQPLPEPYNADVSVANVNHKTNADRIRSMSDEELAEFITSGERSCICPMCLYFETEECYFEGEKAKTNCVQGIMDWLKAESEG